MTETNSLTGKIAFITGGSKGIGYGVAEALMRQGADVAISARSKEDLDAATKKLNELPGEAQAIGVVCDVQNFDELQDAVAETTKKLGTPSIVVANAGIGKFGSVVDMSLDDWHSVVNTNINGVFYTVKATLDALRETKGFLVTIASLAGTNFFAGGAAYNASKFAVVGFTQAAMLDLRKHHVRVSTILPGSVATHFAGNEPSSDDDWKIQPEDVGQLVVDLVKMPARTLPSKVEVRPAQTKPKN